MARSLAAALRRRLASGPVDAGTAVIEFVMISVLLVFLLFGVLQVAAVFYVRNIVAASVADGARYGADQNVTTGQARQRAVMLIREGASQSVARNFRCVADVVPGPAGLTYSRVTCTGRVQSFFIPAGALIHPMTVTSRSVKEQ